MTKPKTDVRKELNSIIKNMIMNTFDVDPQIIETINVTIIGATSIADVHLNGLHLGSFRVDELRDQTNRKIVHAIIQKIDVWKCNDLRGLFAISVLR